MLNNHVHLITRLYSIRYISHCWQVHDFYILFLTFITVMNPYSLLRQITCNSCNTGTSIAWCVCTMFKDTHPRASADCRLLTYLMHKWSSVFLINAVLLFCMHALLCYNSVHFLASELNPSNLVNKHYIWWRDCWL